MPVYRHVFRRRKEYVPLTSRIIKTITKGVVLIISPFFKFVIFAGVATCGIIEASTVDLYLFNYSLDWFEVTQTTVVCLKW